MKPNPQVIEQLAIALNDGKTASDQTRQQAQTIVQASLDGDAKADAEGRDAKAAPNSLLDRIEAGRIGTNHKTASSLLNWLGF